MDYQKRQAEQLDILCNDLICAQRGFIKQLEQVSEAAEFYKSIIAPADIDQLLAVAGRFIGRRIEGAHTVLFIRKTDGFELHLCQAGQYGDAGEAHPEDIFTAEIVESICRANTVISLEQLPAMGFIDGNLSAIAGQISAYTIPLNDGAIALGFLLLWCNGKGKIDREQLNCVRAIVSGLAMGVGRALKSAAVSNF